MSDKRTRTKLEDLSNEVLMDCFEYLNAPDVFYAFEQLNPRFYRLVRAIPLRLNFEDIDKIIFDRFCEKMLDYTEIQQQIYSIKLSNEQTHGQIQAFFIYFSLVEFTRLRSLTLIDIKENNMEQLSSTIPLLTKLTCLRLINSQSPSFNLLSALPRCRENIFPISSFSQNIVPLTKFSIYFCSLTDIFRLLPQMPFLQYLNVLWGSQFEPLSSAEINRLHGRVNCLERLAVSGCTIDTNDLMSVISCMTNLRSLTILVSGESDIIDASRWQQLITHSLPHLTVFRFNFSSSNQDEIARKYNDFQTDFWIVEHQWYTECLIYESQSSIFTTPWPSYRKLIGLTRNRRFNKSINQSTTSNRVKCLNIFNTELISHSWYFPNVTSLAFGSLPVIKNQIDEQNFVSSLKQVVNLLNVKHLEIPACVETARPTLLLKILRETPHVSSLTTFFCIVNLVKRNKELHQLASEMITKLNFCIRSSSSDACVNKRRDMSLIRQVFPNLEQITYSMIRFEPCLFLLKNLPRLSRMSITFYQRDEDGCFDELKNELSKLKNIFFHEELLGVRHDCKVILFSFWVSRGDVNP
ncbi:unnamed protein product [Adineta ricciae]|uniref:F-box domain-containing protein n=1 Tax=Adineta ricciae TaxID=249248 RepID=A0A814SLV1_ADIRI|nr:unnamed protein product [Adineta ricciae]CAF1319516.1 unnamed protein product [Adineta ricciae]